MKNFLLISSFIISVFLSTGCNQPTNGESKTPKVDTPVVVAAPPINSSPEKLKLSDIKSACDWVNAMQKLIVAINKEKGDDPIDELDESQKKKIRKLFRKLDKVQEADRYSDDEKKECQNYADVRGKVVIMEEEWKDDLEKNPEEESDDTSEL
jgi:hypothetical protein